METANATVDEKFEESADVAVSDNSERTTTVEPPKKSEAKANVLQKPKAEKQKPKTTVTQNQGPSNNKAKKQRPKAAKPSFDIVTHTTAKSVSYRNISVYNKQLENQLLYCSRITRSLMTITGSLVRCKKFEIQKEFDAYVELLLLSFTNTATETLAQYTKKVEVCQAQGYEFVESGNPAKVRIEVRSNHVAMLLELIMLIDKCMIMASRLEKTPELTTPELYDLFATWLVIPRQINSRFMSMIDILDSKFRLKVKGKTDEHSTKDVQFDDVHQFMQQLREDQQNTGRIDIPPALRKESKKKQSDVVKSTPAPKAKVEQQVAVTTEMKNQEETVPKEAKAKRDFLNWDN